MATRPTTKVAPPRVGAHLWLPAKQSTADEPYVRYTLAAPPDHLAKQLQLTTADGKNHLTSPADEYHLANDDAGATAPDHCAMLNMNEPCVLENSRARFAASAIYTYVGHILIAINPFQRLPLYGAEIMARYRDQPLNTPGVEPHVYAIGEAAYSHVRATGAPTALTMSGESGAGKTETTKHLMAYLAWCSDRCSSGGGEAKRLADAILQSSPILESFGNAKTVRNNNSSRFGKMMRLHFAPSGEMVGAFIKSYLLEQSRIVSTSEPERSYHIFYQLMEAAPSAAKGPLLGKLKAEQLAMLNKSSCFTLPGGRGGIGGASDAADFDEVCKAFETLGVPRESVDGLWRVLCGLLLLGNVTFTEGADELASVANRDVVSAAEELLGCSGLESNLTSKTLARLGKVGRKKAEAEATRDAAIKGVYVRIFDWVVGRVNESIAGAVGALSKPYIGLLDIFGFEDFKFNSFEQLCINLTNEKLQQFFLRSVFNSEKEEHAREGVTLPPIEVEDNQPCIDMLEKGTSSVFRLLDSQCKTPNASEEAFARAVYESHKGCAFLAPTRAHKLRDGDGFVVRHFAGDVVYHVSAVVARSSKRPEVGWLEKNLNKMDGDWLASLAASSSKLLSSIFGPLATEAQGAAKSSKGGGAPTLSKTFVADLSSLVAELEASRPYFVRCIKPNPTAAPGGFVGRLVLDQLRCSGLIGAVTLMQAAYPTRVPYESIYEKCEKILGSSMIEELFGKGSSNGKYVWDKKMPSLRDSSIRWDKGGAAPSEEKRERYLCAPTYFCEKVLQVLGGGREGSYAFGKTKLFLKAGGASFLQDLAEMRPEVLRKSIRGELDAARSRIARTAHMIWFMMRWKIRVFAARWERQRVAAERLQHAWRGVPVRRLYVQWSTARRDRLRTEAERAAIAERERREKLDAEAKQRRLEREYAEAMELVRKVETMELDKALDTFTKAAQKASREACNAVKVKLEAEWQEQEAAFEKDPDGAAAKWKTRWTLDSVLAEFKATTKREEAAAETKVASKRGELAALMEAHVAAADGKIKVHIFEETDDATLADYQVKLIELEREAALQVAGRGRSLSNLSRASAGRRQSMAVTAAAAEATIFEDDEVEAADAAAPAAAGEAAANTNEVVLEPPAYTKALAPPSESAATLTRNRSRTLGGMWKSSAWEDTSDGTRIIRVTLDIGAGAPLGLDVDNWNGDTVVTRIQPGSAAEACSFIEVGDVIVSVNDVPLVQPTDLLRPRPAKPKLVLGRRKASTQLESIVKVFWSGQWENFNLRLLSNRLVEYEQRGLPFSMGAIKFTEMLAVRVVSANGQTFLEVKTTDKTLQIAPRPKEVAVWRLRLQEVIQTQHTVMYDGWVYKNAAHSMASTERLEVAASVDAARLYWAVLYRNGVLLTFSSPEAAHLGQARGVIQPRSASETCKVVQRLKVGDYASTVLSKDQVVDSVIMGISGRDGSGGASAGRLLTKSTRILSSKVMAPRPEVPPIFRMRLLCVGGGEVDARPSELKYYDVADDRSRPAFEVDSRGFVLFNALTLAATADEWQLIFETKAQAQRWRDKITQAIDDQLVRAPRRETASESDTVLQEGWLEVERYEVEMLALKRFQFELIHSYDDGWVRHWFRLRPGVLELFTPEQRAADAMEEASFTLTLDDVVSVASAKGQAFYKHEIIVRKPGAGEDAVFHLRINSMAEMRQVVANMNMHCVSAASSPGPSAEQMPAWVRNEHIAGWLGQKMSDAEATRLAKSAAGRTVRVLNYGGERWRVVWTVLESMREVQDGTVLEVPRIAIHVNGASDLIDEPDVVIPLSTVSDISLSGRQVGNRTINSTVQVVTSERTWYFAAKEEAQALEWSILLHAQLKQFSRHV